MYSVTYSDKAARALRKLDRHDASMLFGWIDKNLEGCENPRLYGKPLVDNLKGYWRYRVGDYRLIAHIQDEILTIEIIKIGHRRDVYD